MMKRRFENIITSSGIALPTPVASRSTRRFNGSSTRLAASVISRTSSTRSTSIAEGWISPGASGSPWLSIPRYPLPAAYGAAAASKQAEERRGRYMLKIFWNEQLMGYYGP